MRFSAKMHQIQFQVGLRPTPLGELTALPTPVAGGERAASIQPPPQTHRVNPKPKSETPPSTFSFYSKYKEL